MKLQTVFILMSAIMVMAFTACRKDLLNTNTDPNAVSVDKFDPNLLLTASQLYYVGVGAGQEVEETEIEGAGCFIQHWASLNFWGDKYTLNPGGWGDYFDAAYGSQVKNVVDLYHISNKPQYRNLHQMARIVRALIFERLTDIYGDIPYSQAGEAYYSQIYFPVYDKQQDIYADMLKEVSQAVDSLDEGADKVTGDLYYSGATDQIAEWKKFGNTLLLRMAMRLTKVDPATAQAYVTKLQGKTMTSNDDNAIIHHGTDDLTQNKVFKGIVGDGQLVNIKWSQAFIDTLKSKNDPRLSIIAVIDSTKSSAPADQFGLPNGYDAGGTVNGIGHAPGYLGSPNKYSQPSTIVLNQSAPRFVLTYAESELLLADAAKRWGIGDAKTHYENGTKAALTELAIYGDGAVISDDAAKDYITANPYVDARGLQLINTQFWLCTFLNDFEAWSNWRRTGIPSLKPATYTGNLTNGTIPRRMPYTTLEQQVNSANYKAAVARLPGGDVLTGRVWWDVAGGN